jgi:hypothetical protein
MIMLTYYTHLSEEQRKISWRSKGWKPIWSRLLPLQRWKQLQGKLCSGLKAR